MHKKQNNYSTKGSSAASEISSIIVVVIIIIIGLVSSLYVSIQAVKLFPVLSHDCTDHVSDGHHADHPTIVHHRNVPDAIICQIKSSKSWSRDLYHHQSFEVGFFVFLIKKTSTCHQLHCLQNFSIQGYRDEFVLQSTRVIVQNESKGDHDRWYELHFATKKEYLFGHDVPNFCRLGWSSLNYDFPEIIWMA